MAYLIYLILWSSFFAYLVFLCHEKKKIVLRDVLIYLTIYGFVAQLRTLSLGINDNMTYTLLIAASFSIIFVNCILDRMNKSMLVVCFMLLAIMAQTYLVFHKELGDIEYTAKELQAELERLLELEKSLQRASKPNFNTFKYSRVFPLRNVDSIMQS